METAVILSYKGLGANLLHLTYCHEIAKKFGPITIITLCRNLEEVLSKDPLIKEIIYLDKYYKKFLDIFNLSNFLKKLQLENIFIFYPSFRFFIASKIAKINNFSSENIIPIKTKELKSKVFGDYSYEVYDTKISRNLRPRHVTQITAYSYMLSKIQKILPKKMYLIDGSDITYEYKTIEYINLFNHSKQEFDKFLSNIKNENIYPEKCSFCSLCDWSDECDKIWEDDNYINLIAGSNKSQIEKLKKHKILK